MSLEAVTVRIDATYEPTLQVGQEVQGGQSLCDEVAGNDSTVCPVPGIVQDIQFDPGDHAFVITIRPNSAS